MARDNYEVYYYQYGRWSLHASFGSDDRDLAVAEGITVEASLGLPARVIREKLDTQSNTLAEAVVWQGAKAATIADSDNMFGVKQPNAKPTEKRAPSQLPPKQRPEKKATPPPRPPVTAAPAKVKKKKKKGRGVFMKVITSFFMSAAIATIGAAVAALSIISLQAMDMIEVANRTPLIFGTFVMLFFISLLYLLNKQLRLLRTLVKSAAPAPSAATAMQSPMMRSAAMRAPDQDIEFDNVEIERGVEDAVENPDDAMPPELDADMDAPPEIEAVNEPAPATQQAAQQAAQPAQQQAATSAAAPTPMPAPAPQQTVPKPEPKQLRDKQNPESTAAEIEARQIFANFVNQAIEGVSKKVGELNTFSRFGLSLLLAGAASTLGQAKRLAREPQLAILKHGLGAAGNTPDRTATFCAELPGYGKNPRYTGMIQSGSKSMAAHLAGDRDAMDGLGAILAEWSKPEKRPSVPSVFTFLFTDIAGSTAMTQQLGNAGAQKVVRAHNTAVRNAITRVKGREVKHTGDGIMAVFSSASAAASASIQMQLDISSHNAANPALPLVVRIGINSGEAVEEDNDFFGAAVQMTARICSKARDGHIWASQSVVDGCKGQRIGFIPRGKFEMKGIQGARPLYEVGWTEAHKNELADL